ncbi:hypothetical protein BMS3Abin05_00941 [bacterium BMS3Abin05]|nr:hypothetical protein BMS3Abin05_00941 [bacterium BMS3Abin05]GBE26854.1 hypothetical protein BMS3Bbin03_00774 [bacterium BMS3Bbin03]
MALKGKYIWFWKGFLIYISISFIVLVTLFFTTSKLSELRIFSHLHWKYLIPLALIIIFRIVFDGLGLKVLIPKFVPISLWQTIKIRLMGMYFAVAVPIPTSHVYFQSYLVSRFKISYAESLGILTVRTLLPALFFLLLIPVYFTIQLPFKNSVILHKIIQLTIVSIIGVILLIIVFLVFPDSFTKGLKKLLKVLLKLKWISSKHYDLLVARIEETISKIGGILQLYFKKEPAILMISLLYIIISFLFEFLTANFVFLVLGLSVSFLKLFFLQFFLKIIIQYAPTPGGTGVDEITYAGLFALFVPKEIVAITVFVWRFFHAYLLILIGGILTFLQFRGRNLQSILEGKDRDADP